MKGRNKSKWKAGLPFGTGMLCVILLFGVFGYWGTKTQISGAIIANGRVEVESQLQSVEHLDGGMVQKIYVRNGDLVSSGETLFRFDDSAIKSELMIIEAQLFEVIARRARLETERDSRINYEAPKLQGSWITSVDDFREKTDGQGRLFQIKRQSLFAALEQLNNQVEQLQIKIEGASAQIKALDGQSTLLEELITTTKDLVNKQLVESSRLTELKIQKLALDGDVGRIASEIAESRNQISSLKLESINIRRRYREQAIENLRDIRFREGELSERRIALKHKMELLTVKSPVAGVVHNMNIVSANSVVTAGENILYIVPEDQNLVIKARITAQDRDSIDLGGQARIRFPSLDQQTTPEVIGQVQRISADSLEDQTTGQFFYETIVIPDAKQMEQIEASQVLIGIPTEVYVTTVNRSPMSYLVKPLEDFFVKALRES